MSRWRIACALTLVSAAAALAFVAARSPNGWLADKSRGKARAADESSEVRAGKLRNQMAVPGAEREGGPTAAAEADYANRAYPIAYVPFALTRAAQNAWKAVKGRSSKNKVGAWTLAGPSSDNFPAVLTFSGAAYTTSGRVTALVIDPACNQARCTVWMGAAGGGVWRTDNALSGSGASWTFVSGSFVTNAIGTLTFDAAEGTLYAGTGEPNASGDSEAGFGIYKSTDRGATWTKLAANTSVPPARVSTATRSSAPRPGRSVFSMLRPTAVRRSTDARSARSWSIRTTRASCTSLPREACAA